MSSQIRCVAALVLIAAAFLSAPLPGYGAGKGFKPGDKVLVTIGPAPVHKGDKVVTTVRAGTNLNVEKVDGKRVYVNVEEKGTKITGWIDSLRLKRAVPKRQRPPKSPAIKIENAELKRSDDDCKVVLTLSEALRRRKETNLLVVYLREDSGVSPTSLVNSTMTGKISFYGASGSPVLTGGAELYRARKYVGFFLFFTPPEEWLGPTPKQVTVPLNAHTLHKGMVIGKKGQLVLYFFKWKESGKSIHDWGTWEVMSTVMVILLGPPKLTPREE